MSMHSVDKIISTVSLSHALTLLLGVIGGSFLERRRVAKPKKTSTDPNIYYQPEVTMMLECFIMLVESPSVTFTGVLCWLSSNTEQLQL